jgi:hypothetical protein
MITFKQQFDKLTEAYIHERVERLDGCACFVGNLLNGNGAWASGRSGIFWQNDKEWVSHFSGVVEDLFTSDGKYIISEVVRREADGLYTPEEVLLLEGVFLSEYRKLVDTKNYEHENALFAAFEKTLDLLKQIHESKGEVVEPFQFQKRHLTTA